MCISPKVYLARKWHFYDTIGLFGNLAALGILPIHTIVAQIVQERVVAGSDVCEAVLFSHEFKSVRFWRNVGCHRNRWPIPGSVSRAIDRSFL